jgi:crossover junction endodeoxyribonuclease RuvC
VRILGIDPGLSTTGYGVVEYANRAITLVEGGRISPGRAKNFYERLAELQRSLSDVIKTLYPDVMVVEEVFSRTAHPRAAIMMAHARGALISAAALTKMPIFHYSATAVRRALLGNGGASKQQVAAMVAQTLHIRGPITPVDVSDALALAITHCQRNGHAREYLVSRNRGKC